MRLNDALRRTHFLPPSVSLSPPFPPRLCGVSSTGAWPPWMPEAEWRARRGPLPGPRSGAGGLGSPSCKGAPGWGEAAGRETGVPSCPGSSQWGVLSSPPRPSSGGRRVAIDRLEGSRAQMYLGVTPSSPLGPCGSRGRRKKGLTGDNDEPAWTNDEDAGK